jgi:hypothetical protein
MLDEFQIEGVTKMISANTGIDCVEEKLGRRLIPMTLPRVRWLEQDEV